MIISNASVYWIRLPEHTDPSKEGYIGVSINAKKRMMDHYTAVIDKKHKNPHLTNAINKYGWDNLIKEVLYNGEENECYLKEAELRPFKAVGWNISPGGHRGPGWPIGRKKSEETLRKIAATNIARKAITAEKKAEKRKIRIEIRQKKRLEKELALEARKKKKEDRKLKALAIKALILQERERRRLKRLSEGTPVGILDHSTRPICKECNANHCEVNYVRKGKLHYRSICAHCGKKKQKKKPNIPNWKRSGYRKKDNCDCCGFKSSYASQITVFHVDGNLTNVEYTNLKSICLNCVEIIKRKEVNWKRGDLTVDY